MGLIRGLVHCLLGIALLCLDIPFVISHVWISQAGDIPVMSFEPLVIVNLTFLILFHETKEDKE